MVPRKRNRLFLGRFKGVCKGDRAPTRIQRSDSCGKRRNNGTDEACLPLAADRMRDVEFVPTQLPLDWFPFHRQRPFPLTSKEKGAEYRPYGCIPFPPHIFLAYTSRSWYDGACKPFHTTLTRTAGRLKGGFYDLSDHFGQHLRPQP